MLHGNLKPSNCLLLRGGGVLKLTDYGPLNRLSDWAGRRRRPPPPPFSISPACLRAVPASVREQRTGSRASPATVNVRTQDAIEVVCITGKN